MGQVDGGADRMSDAEALMWRIGAHDARLRPVITVVAVLDASPGIDLLTERARALTVAAPRFGARVAPAVSAVAPPRLVRDDQLDLRAQVRLVAAPGDGTMDELLAMVGPMASDGLDPSRPLWQMTLVEGMAGGRAAVIIRVHHSLTDGAGAVILAGILFGDGAVTAPPPPPLGHGGVGAALGDLVADLRREAGLGLGLWRAALPVAGRLLLEAVSPPPPPGLPAPEAGPEGALAPLLRSLGGAAALAGGPCSPLMTGRSASAVLATLAYDLEHVRRVGHEEGGTVNDVFVAAVVDGVARYHAKHGVVEGHLRVGVPVDLGQTGPGANHFFPARIVVPLACDPERRLAGVRAAVLAAREEAATVAFDSVAAVAARLPGAEALAARAMLGIDVVASNVPGSPEHLSMGGVRLRQLVPFGPRSGAAVNVTTISYAGALQVGVGIDPAAVVEPATFVACLADAFAAILGLP